MTDIAEELPEKYPTVDSLERAQLDWIGYGTATTRNVRDWGKPKHGGPDIQARIVTKRRRRAGPFDA
jgi:hypothetical protein